VRTVTIAHALACALILSGILGFGLSHRSVLIRRCYPSMETATIYRVRAAHARRLAEKAREPDVREQLETVASDYDRMADEIKPDHMDFGLGRHH
jgi:hypothetical protein